MVAGPSVDVNFETIIAQLAKFANSHLQAKLLREDFSAAAANARFKYLFELRLTNE